MKIFTLFPSKSRIIPYRSAYFIWPLLLLSILYHIYKLQNYSYFDQRLAPIPDWPPGSLNLSAYISPLDDTSLILPNRFCAEKTFLLIIVESSLRNFSQRRAIRRTWGNASHFNYPAFAKMHGHLKGSYFPHLENRIQFYNEYLTGKNESLQASVRLVFIVGLNKFRFYEDPLTQRRLLNEAGQYNDIIQEGFIDTYKNLTLKTMMAMKHVNNRCLYSTAYIFKTDDDAFVNVPNLLHILLGGTVPAVGKQSRLTATSGVLVGRLAIKGLPIKNVRSKWYMPHYMYPNRTYVNFVTGGGYLMSKDVAQRLYQAAWHTDIIYLEDVYLTGVCAHRAQVTPMNNKLFSVFFSRYLCDYKDTIIRQQLDSSKMVKVWNFVTDYSVKCFPSSKLSLKHNYILN